MKFPEPDFELIKNYIADDVVNSAYFERQYEYYSAKMEVPEFNDDNLLFFWIYYLEAYRHSEWSKDVKLFAIWNTYNSDLKKLKAVCNDVQTLGSTHSGNDTNAEKSILNSLLIKAADKKNALSHSVSITSHPLLYDLFTQIKKWVDTQNPVPQPEESKIQTYTKQFIQGTHPLFLYLKDHQFKDRMNVEVYRFIETFLIQIGIVWQDVSDFPEEYLKSIYDKM